LRDYDALVCERPAFHGPAFYEDAGYRRIVHQVWDWTGDTGYSMHLYITRETASGRRVPACAGSSRAKADTISPLCWHGASQRETITPTRRCCCILERLTVS